MNNSLKLLALAISSALLAGCGGGSSSSSSVDSGTGPSPDPVAEGSVASVDATTGEATMLDLASGALVPSQDDAWHIAYQKYVGFSTNGGVSGPGSVQGCIAHQYTDLFDASGTAVSEEFEKLTLENTIENFNSVSADSCTDDDYITDAIEPKIATDDWLDTQTYQPVAGNGFIIQHADGTNYSRISVSNVTIEHGSKYAVTLNTELWNANTQMFDSVVESVDLNVLMGQQYYDLDTATVVSESDDWDVSFASIDRNFVLLTNGGASGNGNGGTGIPLVDGGAHAVTDPTSIGRVEGAQVYRYDSDVGSGVLSEPGSYGPLQYNVAGQHKMWPTFTTYLIKDGADLFKVQVISNYGEDGTQASGNLVYRYHQL